MEMIRARLLELNAEHAPFLDILARSQTATLHELIERPEEAKARLRADWIAPEILADRLRALGKFFANVAPHPRVRGYARLPFLFFQWSGLEEDTREFERLCRSSFAFGFEERFADHHPQFRYLFEYSSFFREPEEACGQFRIRALGHFASTRVDAHDALAAFFPKGSPLVVGYRVPDYPGLLGVSAETATEYFVRMIVHDLGHGFLPMIDLELENLTQWRCSMRHPASRSPNQYRRTKR